MSTLNKNSEQKIEIDGLDEKSNCGDTNQIYIKHVDDPQLYIITQKSAKLSKLIYTTVVSDSDKRDTFGKIESDPFIITNTIRVHTVKFIMDYMKFYNDKPEKCAPETPLKNIHLSIIFGDEYKLFQELHEFKDSDIMNKKFSEISDYINSSVYFDMPVLIKKLASVTASIIKENPVKFNESMNNTKIE